MEKCAVCGISANQKCSGCNAKFYCSRDHQKSGWKSHKNECRCFEVVRNDRLGRYMIAKRDIKPGEIILRESPSLIGPKIISYAMCLGCHKTIHPPAHGDYYKCSKCNWPMCGKNCETSQIHIDECRLMEEKKFISSIRSSGKPKIEASYCVIVPLRLILMKEKNPKIYKTIMELTSHLDQRTNTNLYKALRVNLIPFLKDFMKFSEYSETDILNIAGILDTNCFDVVLQTSQVRARAVYPLTAMMAHECVPNTKHFVDEKFEMKVIACLPIKKGEMILTSYTHPLKSTAERLHQLKEAKCFDCICPRCEDPTEMGTFGSAIKCLKCNEGLVIPSTPLKISSDWRCNKCNQNFSASQVLPILSKARSCLENLNKRSAEECEKYLKTYEATLPPTNVFLIDVKYALCLLYGNVAGFSIEDLTKNQLNRKLQLCKELFEVLEKLEPGMSNSIANTKFELSMTQIAMKKIGGEKDVEAEFKQAQEAFNILMAGSESKSLLDIRMERLKALVRK